VTRRRHLVDNMDHSSKSIDSAAEDDAAAHAVDAAAAETAAADAAAAGNNLADQLVVVYKSYQDYKIVDR
jgi:hypothetical protein